MKEKLIIFGIGKIAEVINYYATSECGYEVAAFCVDDEFKNTDTYLKKPVVVFSEIEKHFSPFEFSMFIAVGYHDLNAFRKQKCTDALSKGYKLISIISPDAKLPGNVTVGYNCFIMPPTIIHPCVAIGNNVFVWSGAMIGHHSVIGDHCWLTSNCNIGGNVKMGEQCFVAMNATVSHSVEIGDLCFLGANTLVVKRLEDERVVIAEATKPIRLTSRQFLKISGFSSL
jgi:sugar O-acyltransferase (sialic acid O-acetyltransferase NeuD family)